MEHIEGAHLTEPKREKITRAAGLGGSAVEALAGLAAVVLAILGLAGLAVIPFASVALIATGAALLFEAAAVASRRSTYTFAAEDEAEQAGVKSAVGADSIAGIGAITLGVLSLIGLDPTTLLPVGAIILGAGLLLSAGGPAAEREGGYGRHAEIARESLAAASGVHVLVGAGAVVLGIIGVLGSAPVLLTLIAVLSIGAAQLLTGASLGGRMSSMLRHGV